MDFGAKPADSGNIFQQVKEWRESRAAHLSNAEVGRLSRLRNDKTNADEAMVIVRVLLLLSTAFCAYCGYLTYCDTFTGFSPMAAAVFSVGLATAVEIAKVFLSGRFLRSVLFGWMFQSFWSLGQWLFVLLLCLGAFYWSVQISTEGLQLFTKNHSEQSQTRKSLAEHLSEATAGIDAQIAAQQGTQDKSMQSKYKGTIVWEAQKTATGAGKNIAALQAQRAEIVKVATAEWQAADGRTTAKIDGWVFWVSKYGGYMELVSALCLLAIAFGERKLTMMNLPHPTGQNGGQSNRTAGTSFAAPHTPPAHRSAAHNAATWQPVSQFQQPVSQSRPVSQVTQPVSQFFGENEAIGADDILGTAKTELMRDMANLNNQNGQRGTVAARMHSVFNRVGRAAETRGFKPSPVKMLEYYNFLESRVLPLMAEKNVSYEYEREMMRALAKLLPQQRPNGYQYEDVEEIRQAA